MNEMLSIILEVMGGLTVVSGGVAAILKFVKTITDKHDDKQKYDDYDTRINDLGARIDTLDLKVQQQINEAHIFAQQALGDIQAKTDSKLETMQTAIDAKLQQMSSELCILTYSNLATLEGLKQLNCNGPVTEAKEKLEKYLNQQAHGEFK